MLGIIVLAEVEAPGFPGKVFYRLGSQTILERILWTAVGCDFAHKVILTMPTGDRGAINGHVFQSGAIKHSLIEHLGRTVDYVFWGRPGNEKERVYYASRQHNLDTILLLRVESTFVPGRLLNIAAENYYSGVQRFVKVGPPDFNEGFSFSIFPFWMLASVMSEVDGIDDALTKRFGVDKVQNVGPGCLPNVPQSLLVNDRAQTPLMARFAEEIDLGADIGDLLNDLVIENSDIGQFTTEEKK